MSDLRFTLTGWVDEEVFAAYLERLYDPEHGDPKPEGCEEETFRDFAQIALDHAKGEFGNTPISFKLEVAAARA